MVLVSIRNVIGCPLTGIIISSHVFKGMWGHKRADYSKGSHWDADIFLFGLWDINLQVLQATLSCRDVNVTSRPWGDFPWVVSVEDPWVCMDQLFRLLRCLYIFLVCAKTWILEGHFGSGTFDQLLKWNFILSWLLSQGCMKAWNSKRERESVSKADHPSALLLSSRSTNRCNLN